MPRRMFFSKQFIRFWGRYRAQVVPDIGTSVNAGSSASRPSDTSGISARGGCGTPYKVHQVNNSTLRFVKDVQSSSVANLQHVQTTQYYRAES
jgi:hypothetical protein